jgi:hypothetical protein
MENDLFELIEKIFESINDGHLVKLRREKENEYKNVTTLILENLGDSKIEALVNEQRRILLTKMNATFKKHLNSIDKTNLTKFCSMDDMQTIDNLEYILNKHLVYKSGFTLDKKIAYLHLFSSYFRIYHDYDLFDIKHPHCRIKYSTLISSNKIFLFISLTASDFLLQIHQINRSSFKTGRHLVKKSIFKYDFQFTETYVYGLFNSHLIDQYDHSLILIKQIDLCTTKPCAYLAYKNFLSNGCELILDCSDYYKIFDQNLTNEKRWGQTTDKTAPFYILSKQESDLINISKELLFYLNSTNESVQLVSRSSGHYLKMISLVNYLNMGTSPYDSFFVDFETSILYLKPIRTSLVYSLNFKSPDRFVSILIQSQCDLDGFEFQALKDSSSSFQEPTIFYFKRNNSTQNLKLVYVF